jgi:hypothetical protein
MSDPKPKSGPKLKAEVRAYTVEEADLAEWLTSQSATKFYVVKIEVLSSGAIEFTISTEKQAERTIVERPYRTVNETRKQADLPPIEEADTTTDPANLDDSHTGPAVIDDGEPVGKADSMPAIASRSEVAGKKRLMTAREIKLAAQKAERAQQAGPNITHREDDDPVPSAIPGR